MVGVDRRTLAMARRLQSLTHVAIKVLEDNMRDPDPNVRHRAAVEVMDRSMGRPKAMIEARVEAVDMGAAHLAALKELATIGLQALPRPGTVIDVSPNVRDNNEED